MSAEGDGSTLVTLHIYDLTRGLLRRHKDGIFGEPVDGMWHTGVSVFGREYFFEGGITSVPSGKSRFGKPKGPYSRRHVVGHTDLLKPEFEKWVRNREKQMYGKLCYHLVEKNCNHFTNEAVVFLTGKPIPDEILTLPRLINSSAIGRLFSPHVDRFFGGWQWMMLKQHWKYRKRLNLQWQHFLTYAGSSPAPKILENTDPLRAHRRYLPCYAAAAEPEHGADATEHPNAPDNPTAGRRRSSASIHRCYSEVSKGARERGVRIVGRPPPRVYVFFPGDAAGLQGLEARLRRVVAAHTPSEQAFHRDGFEALLVRLRGLAETGASAAFRAVDAFNSAPEGGEVPSGRLPQAEARCLVWILGPLAALWRMLASLSYVEKPKQAAAAAASDSSDEESTTSSESALRSAEEVLSTFEGPNRYFPKRNVRSPTAIMAELTARKEHFIAVMDLVSRLAVSVQMAKVLLEGLLEPWQAKALFGAADVAAQTDSELELRELLTGKTGLLGIYTRDFDHLPVPVQILVLRSLCNVYAAHPAFGRLAALSMASTSEPKFLETLGLQTRNALHNKDHPLLRLTSASLLTNTVCYLNKELAGARLKRGGGNVHVRSLPCSPIRRTSPTVIRDPVHPAGAPSPLSPAGQPGPLSGGTSRQAASEDTNAATASTSPTATLSSSTSSLPESACIPTPSETSQRPQARPSDEAAPLPPEPEAKPALMDVCKALRPFLHRHPSHLSPQRYRTCTCTPVKSVARSRRVT